MNMFTELSKIGGNLQQYIHSLQALSSVSNIQYGVENSDCQHNIQ